MLFRSGGNRQVAAAATVEAQLAEELEGEVLKQPMVLYLVEDLLVVVEHLCQDLLQLKPLGEDHR